MSGATVNVFNELVTVSISLSAQYGNEYHDDNIVDLIGGVLDDGVADEEKDSDVLEAVAAQEEGDSSSLDQVVLGSWLHFVLHSACVVDFLHLLN